MEENKTFRLLKVFCFTANKVELLLAIGTVFEFEFDDFVDEFWGEGSVSMLCVSRLCSFFSFGFLVFFSVFGFALTMSKEGGLEELPECFSRMAMRSLRRALSSRASLSSVSSSAIRLSLASMSDMIIFYQINRKTKSKKCVNGYDDFTSREKRIF